MTDWNKAQLKVLESLKDDRNILVSAAAGSGKTAVLVERIIRSVTEKRCGIDELLVVTFTRAAAAQMKTKIIKALEKICEDGGNPHMVKQLSLAENADITTIDSFCNRVVKENFSRIGIDPAYDFYDAQEAKMLQEDILDECFENWYKEDENFSKLSGIFMKKGIDDSFLRDTIFVIYKVSQSHADEHKFFEYVRDQARASGGEIKKLTWVKKLVEQIMNIAENTILKLEKAKEFYTIFKGTELEKLADNMMQVIDADIEYVRNISLGKNLKEMRIAANEKMKTFTKKSACVEAFGPETAYYAEFRNYIKKVFQKLPDMDKIIDEQERNRWITLSLIDYTEKFAERLIEEKKRNKRFEFGDIAHFAYRVLRDSKTGELTPAAVELRDRYRYIYIDEYQDSNDLQEEILNSVARRDDEGRACNIFMVGDVKQSIYRFRLAKPKLFMDKSENYAREDGDGILLNLNTNYRSGKEILDATNFIFSMLMTKELGGIEYDDAAKLNAPEKKEDEQENSEEKPIRPELILMTDFEKDRDAVQEKESEDEDEEEDEQVKSLDLISSDEAEAFMIGKRILEFVNGSDASGKKYNFGDITILMRTVSGTEPMVDVLTNMGIPVKLDSNSGYFDAAEIMTLLGVLAVIDNSRQDIPFTSVLLSEIGKMTEPELALVMTRRPLRRRYMYDMCLDFANAYRDSEDDELRRVAVKLDAVVTLFDKWKSVKSYISIAELIDMILDDTGYDVFVSSMPEGEIRLANVRMLRYRAEVFEKSGFTSLFDFMRYVEKCKVHDIDFGKAEARSDAGNVVHVTSIHSSKGLEYPVVILARTGHGFNLRDMQTAVIMDPEYGLAHDSYEILDNGICVKREGVKRDIFIDMQLRETMAEEMRLLYVAMTRAKERLVITGLTGQPFDTLHYDLGLNPRIKAMLFMILPAINVEGFDKYFELKMFKKTDLIAEYTGRQDGERAAKPEEAYKRLKEKVAQAEAENPKKEDNPYNYRYPYPEAVTAPSKAAVSGIERAYTIKLEEEGVIPRRITAEQPEVPEKEDIYPGTRRGTVVHKIMELLDYSKIDSRDDLDAEIDRIMKKNFFTDEDRKHLRKDMVLGFYSDDEKSLFRRMKNAAAKGMLYREKSFLMGMKPSEIPGMGYSEESFDDDMITVQGIVDAFFYEVGEDGKKTITLIDYKTDNVKRGEELIDRYSVQLELYALSLSRITDAKINGIIFYCFKLHEEVNCPVKLDLDK